MKVEVAYYSKTGNTKKLADFIASTAGVSAHNIKDQNGEVEADILFLGASVYWAGIDGKVKKYIESLDSNKVKEVVIFSTSALAQRAYADLEKRLSNKGIKVAPENFYCRGEFRHMHKGRPNNDDLKEVTEFAQNILDTRKA